MSARWRRGVLRAGAVWWFFLALSYDRMPDRWDRALASAFVAAFMVAVADSIEDDKPETKA